jgi:hypothetical protein
MLSIDKWMKSHFGLSFAMLECVWEYDVEISCKEVGYSGMWVAPYIQNYIQHRVSIATTATCLLTLKGV